MAAVVAGADLAGGTMTGAMQIETPAGSALTFQLSTPFITNQSRLCMSAPGDEGRATRRFSNTARMQEVAPTLLLGKSLALLNQ